MLNILWTLWIFFSTAILVLGFMLYWFPKTVPEILASLFVYGKLDGRNKRHFIVELVQIPKRWFKHFYVFAVLVHSAYLIVIYRLYVLHIPVPHFLKSSIQFLSGPQNVTITPLTAFIVITCMFLHTMRRLYESAWISSYSLSTMNVLHYFIGYWFYFSVPMTFLAEAPGFTDHDVPSSDVFLSMNTVTWYHILGIAFFIYSCWKQHKAHLIFAKLRKDPKGVIHLNVHLIPLDDWFEYISCPHYLAEFLIYVSLMLITGFNHRGWWLILLWVFWMHVTMGLHTHQWYRNKFKEYPKRRKAIIPFIL